MTEPALPLRPHDAIAATICARYLQTTMGTALTVGPDEPQASAAASLAERNFSQAPVVDGGEILGCVFASDLTATSQAYVRRAMTPLRPEALVTSDAPLSELLGWLEQRRFLFVLEGNEVSGFVTISDLNKQPARTYFYLLIAELEMNLASLLRSLAESQDQVVALLPAGRREMLTDRYAQQVDHDIEADLIGACMWADIIKIVGKHEALRAALGFDTANAWRRATGGLDDFRNSVMHPSTHEILEDSATGLARLLRRDRTLRDLLHRTRGALETGVEVVT